MPNSGDWDRFRFEIRFRPECLRDELVNIEAYRLSLGKLILPPDWVRDLQHLHIVRSVHGTTGIEGNPLSEAQVDQQLSAPTRSTAIDQVHRQTQNAEAAFRWVEQEFALGQRICLDHILKVHGLLTTGSDEGDNVPGRLRVGGHSVVVGSPQLGGVHRAPPGGETLRQLLDAYLRFINSDGFRREHPVIQALIAHFYFVTLHPFGNGNGRTTRCIEAAILYGAGYSTYGFYSLSNFFYRNREQYCRLLQATRVEHAYDLTAFLKFGVRGFREELERVNAYVRNRTHRLHYRELVRRCSERRVGQRRRLLNAREARLLHAILDKSTPPDPFSDDPPREATLVDLAPTFDALYVDKSDRTITRELRRLQELGFIRFERRAGGETDWRVAVDLTAISKY